MNHFSAYLRLLRLDNPIGTLLLLWPTLWGLWFAGNGQPAPGIVLIFILGTVLMRSAGCAINDWADRDFDGHVARTRQRPLASGEIPAHHALWLAAGLALIAFILILPLNPLSWLLSIPAVLLAASYPFMKRFFAIPQAYLGIAFGFGIPMAFAAQTGSVPALAWWLLLANVFWTVAYDTEYAMVDREDDLKIGIRTSAITFGRFDIAAVMICHGLFLGLMAWIGDQTARGPIYFAAIIACSLLALAQYRQIRQRQAPACFAAFLANNRIGTLLFAGLAIDYLMA
jgi:4-hydroxybenzoate polyprenyltransferase